MPKAYEKFSRITRRSSTATGSIYYKESGFTVSTEKIFLYTDGVRESITFQTYPDDDRGYLENLVLNKEEDGEYSVYYIMYDFIHEEMLRVGQNLFVDYKKVSVERAYNFDASGITMKGNSDIVNIGDKCYKKVYALTRSESFSDIPGQLEFSEHMPVEEFLPVPCPQPEEGGGGSGSVYIIGIPKFNPIPWNPGPVTNPNPGPGLGLPVNPPAPVRTKPVLNLFGYLLINDPACTPELKMLYKKLVLHERINKLLGNKTEEFDQRKDIALKILDLYNHGYEQTAIDLLDYMNENDYSEESIEFGLDAINNIAQYNNANIISDFLNIARDINLIINFDNSQSNSNVIDVNNIEELYDYFDLFDNPSFEISSNDISQNQKTATVKVKIGALYHLKIEIDQKMTPYEIEHIVSDLEGITFGNEWTQTSTSTEIEGNVVTINIKGKQEIRVAILGQDGVIFKKNWHIRLRIDKRTGKVFGKAIL